jgi:signal transduction histidine kinase
MHKKLFIIILFMLVQVPFVFGHSQFDFSENEALLRKPVKLDGHWNFYWNRFLDPHSDSIDFDSSNINVPSYWNYLKSDGANLPSQGFGTYTIRIILPPDIDERMALFFPSIDVAYAVFVNGTRVGGCGKVADNKDDEIPMYNSGLIYFEPRSDTLSVVVHVSNFHHRRGGIWRSPEIGVESVMVQNRRLNIIRDNISLGILFSFGIFFFIFSFYYKQERAIFYFAIAFLFMFLRGLSTNQISIAILTDISWDWIIRIEYLSMFLTLYFGLWGFNYLNPIAWIERILRYLFFLVAVVCLLILFLPVDVFAFTVFVFWLILAIGLIFFGIQAIKLIQNHVNYSKLYLFGIVLIFLGGIHDTLVSNSVVVHFNFYIMPYIYIFFIFSQSIEFFRRFHETIKKSESLSRELTLLNQGLELKIQERTHELQEKAQIIETQNQRLQQDISLKNRFFSVIGHDVSSPLASVKQGLELLATGTVDESLRGHFLKKLSQSASSLVLLVDNLLSWGLSQNQQMRITPRPRFISPLVENAVMQLHNVADDKGIAIANNIPPERSAFVDEVALVIVLRNLIANALKFTSLAGEIRIEEQLETDRLILKVIDNGIGMDVDRIELILSDQEVRPSTGTNNERGTGLGLALCKELIRLMGSELKIESEPGKGSCFSFSIPLNEPHS